MKYDSQYYQISFSVAYSCLRSFFPKTCKKYIPRLEFMFTRVGKMSAKLMQSGQVHIKNMSN